MASTLKHKGMKRQFVAGRQTRQRFKFIRETVAELRKVVWPTRKQATNLTVIIIIVALFVGLILGLIDFGFAGLVNEVLLR